MDVIGSLFSTRRRIDRRIEKVIDYAALQDERLLAEIEEYEATENVEACFRKFLENYQLGVEGGQVAEIGIWTSGFYGSGKSSFTKYLGLALDPARKVGDRPFLECLLERLRAADVKAMLLKLARNAPTTVIFLDLGAEQLADSAATSVSTVLYYKVLQQLGYSKEKKLARLELTLERQGKLDEFLRLYQERWEQDWYSIHNDPMVGNARAARVVPQVLPRDFPTPASFSQLRFEEATNLRDRAHEMIELLRRKTGRQNILFMIDEAGQYVAPRGELILNLDGLVRDFKELGQGKVWMIATGQQTLAEIVTRAQYNSAELSKLQARFPITIELDARDIKEITYRRLLTKTPEAETRLKTMFRAHGQALITYTRLNGTTLYKTDPDADTFVQFYPFLPHHFDLLLELIRTLARSTGGIGLRSAIKVIQDVLVDVNRLLPAGTSRLADRPLGTLACADDFYNTLRNDIQKVLPHVVAAVDRTTQVLPDKPLAIRAAKAVAVLQTIEGFPCSAENLAAMLYPAVGSPNPLAEVRAVLKEMLAESEIGLVEDPKAGGYVFLSDKVRPLQKKRGDMAVLFGDTMRIRNEILRRLFDPQPSARLEGTKEVKAAVRSSKLLIVGDGEDITFRIEWVDDSQWESRRTALLSETAAQADWQNAIAWLARNDEAVEDLLPEIYRSEKIAEPIDELKADRDEAQYKRSQFKQAEIGRAEVERLLREALHRGTLIFRGRPRPVAEIGDTLDAAARAMLGQAAGDVFPYYRLAPVRAGTDLAARFLTIERYDRVTPEQDPLGLVDRKGGRGQISLSHPALAETLRAFQTKVEESGGGRLLGNFIQDYFSGPPYGWSKDTVRYLLAALLVAGKVEFHTAEPLKVAGPKAAEACKSTVAFNRVGVSLRDAPPDPEALDRAARRLQELFGDTNVLPLEDSISRAVRRHLPTLLETVGALPDRLRLLALPGEERVLSLKASLTSALSGDATDAGAVLGAKDSKFPEDVHWARAVAKAFEEDAERDVRSAGQLRASLAGLEMMFPGEGNRLLPEDESEALKEALSSERFHERLADVRTIVHAALGRAQAHYDQVRSDVEQELDHIETRLEAHPDWLLLSHEERTAIVNKLRSSLPDRSPEGGLIASLTTLLVRQNGLAGLENGLVAEIARRVPAPAADTEGVNDVDVERVALSALRPAGMITSEAELKAWLDGLYSQLAERLSAGKHLRIEDSA